ncbi:Gfo/Idh/MocA family oxidoreductase [Thalassobacillus pellis]|uniref:Gfo/Idh/MocA family oxidoreductase n=1 Tax=Thalassobacillus pellis TaxID=748008 RepID=UPI001960A3B6|nr:putative dehydrogenase [Thalassobacillus pellis]
MNAITKIAIVGAGQIGRRHMQALKRLDRPAHIAIVDPFEESLVKAKRMYDSSSPSTSKLTISYHKNMLDLADNLDVAIIATTSDVREDVIIRLLKNRHVRFILLEKVVFQHPKTFSRMNLLLKDKGCKAWVNCPVRTYPVFRQLKKKIEAYNTMGNISMLTSGTHWNMASNAIHHLDLFFYLTGEHIHSLDSGLLDSKLLASKRQGFFEVTGTLTGSGDSGSHLLLSSYSTGSAPLTVHLSSAFLRFTVNLTEGKALVAEADKNWEWSELDCHIPYQSELTHLIVQKLLDEGNCDLPDYSLSWKLHIPLLETLISHINQQTNRGIEACPIS